MTRNSFTEGAQRALRLAARIAVREDSEIEPIHLLSALLSDESRASEILAMLGLNGKTPDQLDLPEPPDDFYEFESWDTDVATSFNVNQLARSISVEQILGEARQCTASALQSNEIGSEHLLWGLAVVDSPAAKILNQHGINHESLIGLVGEDAIVTGEPLEVDFTIGFTESVKSNTGQHKCAVKSTDAYRVIDAAANRAREGLRVVEDYARFILDDGRLVELLKTCRHDLTASLQTIDQRKLLTARDTEQDVGTRITTASEGRRTTARDIVTASFKRTQEAIRTLEEYAKLIELEPQSMLASQFEQLRYRVYSLEKAMLLTDFHREQLLGRVLYLLLTEANCTNGLENTVRDALAGGVNIIQLREKSKSDREIIKLGNRLRELAHESNALFIMNDRPDLAVVVNADGVHVGQDELSVRDARRIVGTDRLVGVSTHTIEQARQAVIDGANYIGVGPVFVSSTKSFEKLAGLEFVRQVAAEITLPWFAIGGISNDNIDQVKAAGATRIAVSGSICGTVDVARSARQLLRGIESDPFLDKAY